MIFDRVFRDFILGFCRRVVVKFVVGVIENICYGGWVCLLRVYVTGEGVFMRVRIKSDGSVY